MLAIDEQKYVFMENVLQQINANHIALSEHEVRTNNVILNEVLYQIIEQMKRRQLFANLYQKEFYGGSFYDGLKVGKPNEYDLDLLLQLPASIQPFISNSCFPGFVTIQLQNVKQIKKHLEDTNFPGLEKRLLDDDGYLSTKKVLCWMHSLMAKSLNALSPNDKYSAVKIIETTHGLFRVKLKHKKIGPVFTLNIQGEVHCNSVMLDIDLVPCFVFGKDQWPGRPIRPNPVKSETAEYFVVPKQPNNDSNEFIYKYWRLSFQEVESSLIKDLQNFKPTLKLIKRLRDCFNNSTISSYYIKTIFLWEVEQNRTLWDKPLSYIFMTMLKKYQQYIERGNIPFFWSSENNLIDKVKKSTRINTANRLKKLINDVESHPGDPTRIVKYLGKSASSKDVWNSVWSV